MSQVIARATYRNPWADAYRSLVTEQPGRDHRFELVRVASAVSWDSGERLTEDEIRERVEVLTR
ncbi:hypothetical protein E0H75_42250 [Kribbella capetownensis]|uniref:Uncharacterized protein n=1 Tax=Kribbella capetownensis TaxID=1572659 RepID=A0A4R0IK59_9ACTN|nr:hypothetical protein [Kribbella capetownensis]TCC33883.1 hypothetical protein E0H75_42250 [Kribbella capetownensis]